MQSQNNTEESKIENHKKRSARKLLLLFILAAMTVFAFGFTGYTWYQQIRAYKASVAKQDQQIAELTQRLEELRGDNLQTSNLKSAKIGDLGVAMQYPSSWGDVKVTEGPTQEPIEASYKQVTFTKQSDIDINFVLDAVYSPFDGCPTALAAAQHDSLYNRARIIGWEGATLKSYVAQYDTAGSPRVKTVQPIERDNPNSSIGGWIQVARDSKVLIYKDKTTDPFQESVEGDQSCRTTTKAEAAEANQYYKYLRYALNYENITVKGVNAHYKILNGDNSEIQNQLSDVLNSIKDL